MEIWIFINLCFGVLSIILALSREIVKRVNAWEIAFDIVVLMLTIIPAGYQAWKIWGQL